MIFLLKEKNIFFAVFLIVALFAMCVFSILFFNPYPLKYQHQILHSANTFGVEPAIIASIINAESGFDPNAVSHQGAVGLMQIMPTTANWVCSLLERPFEKNNLFDPEENIIIGTYYFHYLLQKFEDAKTALAAYNAGEGNVMLWLESEKFSCDKKVLFTTPFKETNAYVDKVMSCVTIYHKKLMA